eukprot:CAMPEP_0185622796 /NCGR_PEP_ID=MMETSP0436-20130131/59446_1 /TAXON_ID=626734 ORGANISM="Favella taraikaensis, Strain Fe Narragansett Bay" /NCGR_SAMPLE_ID=MMETSP0436 /ASSEMBLY_ACC=CAM_ASM_000390 /LENGTH=56 /DNA_ID=CAMNT_0028264617 /DNA_START=819 /DNA_END=986 /DNA_ORIENTATION=+
MHAPENPGSATTFYAAQHQDDILAKKEKLIATLLRDKSPTWLQQVTALATRQVPLC